MFQTTTLGVTLKASSDKNNWNTTPFWALFHLQCRHQHKSSIHHYLVGGFNPSEKYYSVGVIILNIRKTKSHVPNHQPVMHIHPWVDKPIQVKAGNLEIRLVRQFQQNHHSKLKKNTAKSHLLLHSHQFHHRNSETKISPNFSQALFTTNLTARAPPGSTRAATSTVLATSGCRRAERPRWRDSPRPQRCGWRPRRARSRPQKNYYGAQRGQNSNRFLHSTSYANNCIYIYVYIYVYIYICI